MNSWRIANERQERTDAWLHEFIPVNELQKETLLIVCYHGSRRQVVNMYTRPVEEPC